MCNYRVLGGVSWIARLLGSTVVGTILVGPVFSADDVSTEFSVPPALSADLGWQPLPGKNYRPYRSGSVFAVGSEPAKWPAALDQATAWVSSAPAFDQNPSEYLFRKLARIEALALGSADAGTAAELRAERKALGERAEQLRAHKSNDRSDWQARNSAEQLQEN